MSIIQNAFQHNLDDFISTYKPMANKIKSFNHIIDCRRNLGSFMTTCSNCDHQSIGLCACDDRHCPICANRRNNLFLEKENAKLLPVNYYHITFTVPHILNDLTLHNQGLLYNILFKSSIDSLKQILSDSKYMGASTISATSILHTWGSNMSYHPHLHLCLAGVGLNKLGNLVYPKNESFIFPEAVISAVFKAIFLKHLNQSIPALHLNFDDLLDIRQLLIDLNILTWVVNIKNTLKNPTSVINYFARYAYRICIAESRILNYDEDKNTITFKYKDYKDNSKQKEMTLSALEFMRRFSLHMLPKRFRKIRSYGFLAPNNDDLLLLIASKLHVKLSLIKTRKLPIYCKHCNSKVIISLIPFDKVSYFNNIPNYFKIGVDNDDVLRI